MNKEKRWLYENKVTSLIQKLKHNNIEGAYFPNKTEALEAIISSIPKEWVIGFGGSTTVREIGLLDKLLAGDFKVLNRFKAGLSKEEKWEIQRKSLLSDLFITGTNAITMKGEIVNIDHSGNRVSGILFGPNRVYIIVGVNKIVDNLDEAVSRAQHFAAPMNAKRAEHEYSPPCIKIGSCIECDSPERVCNSLVVAKRQYKAGRMKVFIIGEELGY